MLHIRKLTQSASHLLLALLIVSSTTAGAETGSATTRAWHEFLAKPTKEHLDPIARMIAACKKDSDCRSRSAPNSAQVVRFIGLVPKGDAVVIEGAFLASTVMHFSGGDYDDLVRSLGEVSERDPALFLRLVSRYGKNQDLLVMLPYDTVDNVPLQLQVVDRRRARLAAVSASELASSRSWAIEVLDRMRASLSKD